MSVLNYMFQRRPFEIIFPITYRCNSDCGMCNRLKFAKMEELSLDEIKKIFTDLKKFGISRINLTGGEPTLRDDFFEVLDFLTSVDFKITLTTNGTLLNDEKIRRLVKYHSVKVIISVDTLKRELYKKLRGVDALDKVLENIDLFKKIAPSYPLRIHMVISRLNCGEVNDLISFAKKKNIMLSAAPYNYLSHLERKNKEMAYDSETKCVIEAIENLRKHVGQDYLSGFSIFYKKAIDWILGKPIGRCNAGYETIYMNVDGNVSACGTLKPFGNLRKRSIFGIWDREKILKDVRPCYRKPLCYVGCYWGFALLKQNKLSLLRDLLKIKKMIRIFSGKEY